MIFLVIVLICYLIVEIIKKTPIDNEWLPLISGVLGIILSIVSYFALPDYLPVNGLDQVLVYGLFSGLAATGGNQVWKQAVKYLKNKYGLHDFNIGE